MKITLSDGKEFAGTALQIVRGMQSSSPFTSGLTLREYVVQSMARADEEADLDGEDAAAEVLEMVSDADVAAEFLETLVEAGLAVKEG